MRIINTARLRELEVINLCGGERLGYPVEFEIDVDCGSVISILVSENEGFNIFAKKDEYILPWTKIECIGEDAILVRMNRGELSACTFDRKGRGKKNKFR